MDILDVWFESGASWHAVLDLEPELHSPADLYTEGGDQHRGWFHSSLLTSVAVRNHAPYKMVATSGWTLDEQGRAFSKSLGNGVDPVDIAKRLGGEIIRLWVASVDFREDVAASENLMQRVSDNYRKLRNTLRFLLGNLHDFDPSTNAVHFSQMEPLDQYILARTAELDAKIREAYDDFEFHRAYHALNEYVNTDLSALYLDVLKDRLYTFAPNHPGRRSAQTALWRIAEALTRLIAPILSFTADEVWQLLPQVEGREPSVHLSLFPDVADIVPGSTARTRRRLGPTPHPPRRGTQGPRRGPHRQDHQQQTLRDPDRPRLAQLHRRAAESRLRAIQIHPPRTLRRRPGRDLERHRHRRPGRQRSLLRPGQTCRWLQVRTLLALHRRRRQTSKYPTVCLRCAEALEAIDFPPYTAPTPAKQRSRKPDVLDQPRRHRRNTTCKPATSAVVLLVISAAVVLIDRITKRIVVQQLPNGQAHTVIPGIFRITDVHNTGAAFSMFAETASPATVRNILIAFSVIAVLILVAMLWRVGRTITLSSVALALILGGAFGNLYDRVRYHYVVDFLEVHIHPITGPTST